MFDSRVLRVLNIFFERLKDPTRASPELFRMSKHVPNVVLAAKLRPKNLLVHLILFWLNLQNDLPFRPNW